MSIRTIGIVAACLGLSASSAFAQQQGDEPLAETPAAEDWGMTVIELGYADAEEVAARYVPLRSRARQVEQPEDGAGDSALVDGAGARPVDGDACRAEVLVQQAGVRVLGGVEDDHAVGGVPGQRFHRGLNSKSKASW